MHTLEQRCAHTRVVSAITTVLVQRLCRDSQRCSVTVLVVHDGPDRHQEQDL